MCAHAARPAPTSLDEVRKGLLELHQDVTKLLRKVLQTHASIRMAWRRARLDPLEAELDERLQSFFALDEALLQYANPPVDTNFAMRHAAIFSSHVAVRDSVSGLLADTSAALSALRGRLDVSGSLVISVMALVVAAIALVLDVLR